MVPYNHEMIAALESATEVSLETPTIVNAEIIAKSNELVVDYVCHDAIATSLLIIMDDGTTHVVPIAEVSIRIDRLIAEEFVSFTPVATLANIMSEDKIRRIVRVSLGFGNKPISEPVPVDYRDDL